MTGSVPHDAPHNDFARLAGCVLVERVAKAVPLQDGANVCFNNLDRGVLVSRAPVAIRNRLVLGDGRALGLKRGHGLIKGAFRVARFLVQGHGAKLFNDFDGALSVNRFFNQRLDIYHRRRGHARDRQRFSFR